MEERALQHINVALWFAQTIKQRLCIGLYNPTFRIFPKEFRFFSETPLAKAQEVLPSFHLFTLVRKGTAMETESILSRPTRTGEDMTVESANPPLLPSVAPLRCDLRPSPGEAFIQPTKRRERYACTGVVAHLTVLWLLVGYNIAQLY
jgi:hypothetical protein